MNNSQPLRIALAQLNLTVGSLDANRDKILTCIEKCRDMGCHLTAFPELCVSGYPPEDLVLRKQFIVDQIKIVNEIAHHVTHMPCVIGMIDEQNDELFNAAAILQNGAVQTIYHKIHLPNYSVFDEERYFTAGTVPWIINLNGIKIGISICEDIWIAGSVIDAQVLCGGAEVVLNISASPFYQGKYHERFKLISSYAQRLCAPVAYVNLVGGQDELVFDGRSFIVNETGQLLARAKAFDEEILFCEIDVSAARALRAASAKFKHSNQDFTFPDIETVVLGSKNIVDPPPLVPSLHQDINALTEIYDALILGLKDYVLKNGFSKVTLGLSGGIDSALVAVLATDALGKGNVVCVGLPSQYSSDSSLNDARLLTQNLDVRLLIFSIQEVYQKYLSLFSETFKGLPFNVTEENLQARIRANILMALSNKFGWLVLTTGNKSEVSVGYSTIYGDSAGGFAPLKDVYKTMVYSLSEYRNSLAGYDLIPQSILVKPPSAELRPNQKDQDSLPPYELLDGILQHYIEEQHSLNDIVAKGFELKMVQEVIRLVNNNEYKRRQAAPGTKITQRAFGRDRRMPITNRYQEK